MAAIADMISEVLMDIKNVEAAHKVRARVRELTAWVKPAARKATLVPRWSGGKMALSTQLATATRGLIAAGRARPSMVAIRGGSAGGWTSLDCSREAETGLPSSNLSRRCPRKFRPSPTRAVTLGFSSGRWCCVG